jgi:uncharacterized repeat protein (TIGR03803 family)
MLSPVQGGWNFQVIWSNFPGSAASLTMDSAGNICGVSGGGLYQAGSIFKLTRGNGGWTYTSLYDFTGGNDGSGPAGSLILDGAGNIYGTTSRGGSANYGVVWELKP